MIRRILAYPFLSFGLLCVETGCFIMRIGVGIWPNTASEDDDA